MCDRPGLSRPNSARLPVTNIFPPNTINKSSAWNKGSRPEARGQNPKRVVDGPTFDPERWKMLATYDQTDTEGAG